jgi:two-component system, NtrC family, response regulator HupR/HoxA
MPKETVLIVDDQPEVLHSLERLLKKEWTIRLAPNGAEALRMLAKGGIAVIISDQRMPGMTGVEFLEKSVEAAPWAVRMLITAYADVQASIEAVNRGKIFYYISKPWEPEELLLIVRRAVEHFRLQEENRSLTRRLMEANERLKDENILLQRNIEKDARFENLVGHSPGMLGVFKLVSKVADAPTTVLLLGETGTGKELLARAIHYNSGRRDRLFVAQNCGALPDSLLESELFGHVRGAFTGAVRDKKGIFELADGGTVFLDEIADTSQAMQSRLLRVLQDGEIRPVGGVKTVKTNARIIAATNKPIEEEVRSGRFREDLYYRLNVFPVTLPPLRDRREDIADIAELFVKKFSDRLGKKIRSISTEALRLLRTADYPGNVRELENEIERAVTLAESGGAIKPEHLSPRFRTREESGPEPGNGRGGMKTSVESLEKRLILDALSRAENNVSKAASALGLSRMGLYKKIARYKIEVRE